MLIFSFSTAIELTNESRSIIVGDDVDLLELLTAPMPENKDIYYESGKSNIDTII